MTVMRQAMQIALAMDDLKKRSSAQGLCDQQIAAMEKEAQHQATTTTDNVVTCYARLLGERCKEIA